MSSGKQLQAPSTPIWGDGTLILGLTLARYGNAGLGLVAHAMLARRLGPTDYGSLVAIISVHAVAAIAAEWSTEQHVVRRYAASIESDGYSALLESTTLRLVTGPAFTAAGLTLFGMTMSYEGDRLVALVVVWASSVPSFASLAPAAALGQDRPEAYLLLSQIPGLTWSALAIAVSVVRPTLLTACAAFSTSGLVAALIFIVALHRSKTVHRFPGVGSPRAALAVARELAPSAIGQSGILAPWKLLPAAVSFATSGGATAGLVIASVRFWEQVAVPAVAISQLRAPASARLGSSAVSDSLRSVALALAAMSTAAVPAALAYGHFVLGPEYAELGIGILAGAGVGAVAGLSQSLVPILLPAQKTREALAAAMWLVSLMGLTTVVLHHLHDPDLILFTVTLVSGAGGILAVLHVLRAEVSSATVRSAVLLAALVVAVAAIGVQ